MNDEVRTGRCDECGQAGKLRRIDRAAYCPKCFDHMKAHHERLPEVYGGKSAMQITEELGKTIQSAEEFAEAKEEDRKHRAAKRLGKYHAALSRDAQTWRVVDAQGNTVRSGFPSAHFAAKDAELRNAAALDAELVKAHDEMNRQGFPRSGWGEVEEAHAAELAEVQIDGMDADEVRKLAREQLVERYRRDPAQLEDDYDYLHMTRPDGEAGKEGS